ncbi:hypothetical protein Bca4012_011333 [Brassica carinata]
MKPGYMDVVEANDEEINVNGQTKTVVSKLNDVYPKDPQFLEPGVDDMTKLAFNLFTNLLSGGSFGLMPIAEGAVSDLFGRPLILSFYD